MLLQNLRRFKLFLAKSADNEERKFGMYEHYAHIEYLKERGKDIFESPFSNETSYYGRSKDELLKDTAILSRQVLCDSCDPFNVGIKNDDIMNWGEKFESNALEIGCIAVLAATGINVVCQDGVWNAWFAAPDTPYIIEKIHEFNLGYIDGIEITVFNDDTGEEVHGVWTFDQIFNGDYPSIDFGKFSEMVGEWYGYGDPEHKFYNLMVSEFGYRIRIHI